MRYAAGEPQLNEWSLTGKWTIGNERAQLDEQDGSIVYRFPRARFAPCPRTFGEGEKIPLPCHDRRQAPGEAHGMDVDADGNGVGHPRNGCISWSAARALLPTTTFEIRFLDPGVQAYAFTFG